MATLPWTTNTAPDRSAESVVLGSRLELRSIGDTVRFLRAALQVRKQVLASHGAIGVSLIAQPAHTFTTWSVPVDDLPKARSSAKELWRSARERLAATAR